MSRSEAKSSKLYVTTAQFYAKIGDKWYPQDELNRKNSLAGIYPGQCVAPDAKLEEEDKVEISITPFIPAEGWKDEIDKFKSKMDDWDKNEENKEKFKGLLLRSQNLRFWATSAYKLRKLSKKAIVQRVKTYYQDFPAQIVQNFRQPFLR